MATRKNVDINIGALLKDLENVEGLSDRVRIAGYGLASPLLRMREAQMKREVKRVAAKKGADHQEVAARMASLKRTEERRVQFDEELSRARIDQVKLTKDNSAGIYGRVAEAGKPLENMTVIAYADKERVDFTCTKENGAFSMEVPAESEVVISVRTNEGAEVYRDPEGAVLQPKEQRFKEIDLRRAPQQPCADPVDERPEDEKLIMVNLIGQTEADAVGIINTQGLTLGKRITRPVDEGVGIVLEQDPQPGTVVRRGDVVSIVVGSSNLVTVPDLTGLRQEEVEKLLEEKDLQLDQVNIVSVRAVQAGLVVNQDPSPGSQVPRGNAVSIEVGDENEVTVPNLIGRSQDDGMAILEEVGLQPGGVKSTPVSTEKVGIIIDQDPQVGTRVPLGEVISITVGRADAVTVPNVVGRTEDEGVSIIKKAGLTVGERSTAPVSEEKAGSIIRQNPAAGGQVVRGSAVAIEIGRVDEVTVPKLIGRTKDEAAQFVERTGLVLGDTSVSPVSSPDEVGRVVSQDPKSGSVVPRGTPITISIGELHEVEVPDVVGRKLDEAQAVIQEASLSVGKITQFPVTAERAGLVLKQDPDAGRSVSPGAIVNMQVGTFRVFEFKEVVARAEESMLESDVNIDEDPGFLARRLDETGINTVPELQAFLKLDPREIRDRLGFRNLIITRTMKSAFKKIFGSG